MKFICFLGHFSYNLMWSDKGRDTVDEACKEKKEEVINCLVKRKWLSKCYFWIRAIFCLFGGIQNLYSKVSFQLLLSEAWGILLRIDIFNRKLFSFLALVSSRAATLSWHISTIWNVFASILRFKTMLRIFKGRKLYVMI